MKRILIILLIACSTSIMLLSEAISTEVEIANLVLNKTITRIGNEFYEAFSDNWYPPRNMEIAHIKIAEAPSARWGSLISISANGRAFFKTRLSTRSKNIEEIAQQAAQTVMVQLMREAINKQQQNGPSDLYGDGL